MNDYLYFRLKESRAFKTINYNEVYTGNINNAIYEYIKNNVIGRYKYENMEFYVKYYDIITDQSIKKNILVQYNPVFTLDVFAVENQVTDFSIVDLDIYNFDTIVVQYNQNKPSTKFSFNYYFNLTFSKV